MRKTENFTNRALDRVDDERLALKINQKINKYRPKWSQFGDVFSLEEMRADQQEILDYQEKKHIVPEQEQRTLKDGLLVEKMFVDSDSNDLLAEEVGDFIWKLPDDGENGDHLLATIPAHLYDDYFNNIDVICSVRNALTDHKEVTFAVDCTSNPEKVREKMGYLRTEEQIPGFTEIKYFHDTAMVGAKPLPTGHLKKVPRFIVGFDADLAREVAEYDPEESNAWTREEQEQRFDQARYYILTELYAQAKDRDEHLEQYFGGLLDNFVKTRGEKTVRQYPDDAVMNDIVASAKQQPAKAA